MNKPPKALTTWIMKDDGGELPAYCLISAYRSKAEAADALALLTSTTKGIPTVDQKPLAWVVFWGIGNMRPAAGVYLTKELAENAASRIKSNTKVVPLVMKPEVPDGWADSLMWAKLVLSGNSQQAERIAYSAAQAIIDMDAKLKQPGETLKGE